MTTEDDASAALAVWFDKTRPQDERNAALVTWGAYVEERALQHVSAKAKRFYWRAIERLVGPEALAGSTAP